MAKMEIKVKKGAEKETEALIEWPRLDAPFFHGNFFELNPFAIMKRFSEELYRFFNSVPGTGIWAPPIEVKEEGGKFRVTAELPGVKPHDVKVHVTEEVVIVEGEREAEEGEKHEGAYHSERSYGRFYRAIPLPKGADTDKASADYNNGVLEIRIPVPEARAKPKEIPVKHAA